MLKAATIVVLAGVLSGCHYQSVDSNDIRDAAIICGGLENVVAIHSTFLGSEWVGCADRQFVHITPESLAHVKNRLSK